MTAPRSVLVVGDGTRAAVAQTVDRLVGLLAGRVDVRGVELDASADLSGADAELIVVIGGDGAILSAARRLAGGSIPLLGVNIGKLGFLAAVRAREIEHAVESVLVGGRFAVSTRRMLEAVVRHADGRSAGPMHALNDVVVERWDARSIEVEFRVDGRVATTYRGDGLIVATPTGSTAHSLAAGGPIAEPGVDGIVVSPICAHSVANRPLVLRSDRILLLRVVAGSEKPGLAVDGQVLVDLARGDEIEVRRSSRVLRLAVPEDRSFFDVLRTRLHWAGRPPDGGS